MGVRDLLYGAYERRIVASLDPADLPKHVGVILDGNRRWAQGQGSSTDHGHRAGARKIVDLLGWCEEAGISHVTLWLLSTDNLSRPAEQLDPLLDIIANTVDELGAAQRWRLRPVGALDLLPDRVVTTLKDAQTATEDVDGLTVNIAVGYGGRQEVVDAVRALLTEHAGEGTSLEDLAAVIDVEHIAAHLYTKGQPDPDLVIRTSGEQRLSGFLLWQSVHSEFWFADALWPDFRRVDFLRALRSYAARHRRFGS